MDEGRREELEVLQIGRDYAALKASGGWKRLFAFMRDHANDALAKLEQSRSSDPHTTSRMVYLWQEREAFFQAVNAHIDSAITARDELARSSKTTEDIETLEEMYDG